jgi:cytochrome c-type biogenesis protein
MSGVSTDDLSERRGRLLVASLLFVAGFAAVFTALGATASLAGSMVATHRQVLLQISGGFIVVMGLITVGVFKLPALYMERRFHMRTDWGLAGALPLGMAFAFGWTPCIGPVLASIEALAGAEGSVRTGAALLFVYALGLGLPFVAAGLFFAQGVSAIRWLQRHYRLLNLAGGSVLLLMGTLLLSGEWVQFLSPALRLYSRLNWPPV